MDPGTAVGVVPLGIQVCEAILKYYCDWKGYEDDIRETYMGIGDLAKTSKLLYDELKKVLQKSFATRVQECVTTCQEGFQQLEKKLKTPHKEAMAGLRQRAQAGGLRLTYPLWKSTLAKLKEVVHGMIQQLNLAVHIIHLDNNYSIQLIADQIQVTVQTTDTHLMTSWYVTQYSINETGVNGDIDTHVKNALATERKLIKLSSTTKTEI
ncbi:hypothetical protein G6011_01740 [Alternaria panax]|uniref:Fungal N-terminal domain-containing protein n=1 Tax=Alternaria panax TaxID=48097 RepID=A0AAD4ILA2_9PLEO|nr:hypothetical protein G6011_01740 [Alternaria panax]